MMRRIRARLDARTLRRAKSVFERRGWTDAPGYTPVVADTVAQLGYRSRALRLDRGYR
jgi:hypothetical protein